MLPILPIAGAEGGLEERIGNFFRRTGPYSEKDCPVDAQSEVRVVDRLPPQFVIMWSERVPQDIDLDRVYEILYPDISRELR